MWRWTAFFLPLLFCQLMAAPLCHAAYSGSASRPFPAIMPLDYPLCRAEAWLSALAEASDFSPAADRRLADAQLGSPLGKLALGAICFQVETVTPDILADGEIRVFLKEPPDPAAAINEAWRKPGAIYRAMALVAETRSAARKLRATWPHSLEAARADLERIDNLVERLVFFWKLTLSPDSWLDIETPPDAAAYGPLGALLLSENRLAAGLPQAALEAAEEASSLCRRRMADNEDVAAWIYMEGWAARICAIAHFRLGQAALAESDIRKATRLLSGLALKTSLLAQAWVDSGEIARARRNWDFMCSSWREACLLGLCQYFFRARSLGRCKDK